MQWGSCNTGKICEKFGLIEFFFHWREIDSYIQDKKGHSEQSGRRWWPLAQAMLQHFSKNYFFVHTNLLIHYVGKCASCPIVQVKNATVMEEVNFFQWAVNFF